MASNRGQLTFWRWYLRGKPNAGKDPHMPKAMTIVSGSLLVIGFFGLLFYANYANRSNWDFVRKAYRNPFVILAIVMIVAYDFVNDYLEYRVTYKHNDTVSSLNETILVRYERSYGKDLFYRLRFAMLAGSFLAGLIGIVMLCMKLATP